MNSEDCITEKAARLSESISKEVATLNLSFRTGLLIATAGGSVVGEENTPTTRLDMMNGRGSVKIFSDITNSFGHSSKFHNWNARASRPRDLFVVHRAVVETLKAREPTNYEMDEQNLTPLGMLTEIMLLINQYALENAGKGSVWWDLFENIRTCLQLSGNNFNRTTAWLKERAGSESRCTGWLAVKLLLGQLSRVHVSPMPAQEMMGVVLYAGGLEAINDDRAGEVLVLGEQLEGKGILIPQSEFTLIAPREEQLNYEVVVSMQASVQAIRTLAVRTPESVGIQIVMDIIKKLGYIKPTAEYSGMIADTIGTMAYKNKSHSDMLRQLNGRIHRVRVETLRMLVTFLGLESSRPGEEGRSRKDLVSTLEAKTRRKGSGAFASLMDNVMLDKTGKAGRDFKPMDYERMLRTVGETVESEEGYTEPDGSSPDTETVPGSGLVRDKGHETMENIRIRILSNRWIRGCWAFVDCMCQSESQRRQVTTLLRKIGDGGIQGSPTHPSTEWTIGFIEDTTAFFWATFDYLRRQICALATQHHREKWKRSAFTSVVNMVLLNSIPVEIIKLLEENGIEDPATKHLEPYYRNLRKVQGRDEFTACSTFRVCSLVLQPPTRTPKPLGGRVFHERSVQPIIKEVAMFINEGIWFGSHEISDEDDYAPSENAHLKALVDGPGSPLLGILDKFYIRAVRGIAELPNNPVTIRARRNTKQARKVEATTGGGGTDDGTPVNNATTRVYELESHQGNEYPDESSDEDEDDRPLVDIAHQKDLVKGTKRATPPLTQRSVDSSKKQKRYTSGSHDRAMDEQTAAEEEKGIDGIVHGIIESLMDETDLVGFIDGVEELLDVYLAGEDSAQARMRRQLGKAKQLLKQAEKDMTHIE